MQSNPMLYNGFWLSPNLRIGAWSTQTEAPTQEQQINANNIKSFFEIENWTLEAICGMLGNMQAESTLNPALIQETNRWRLPNSGTDLDTLPNTVMQNFYKEYYGVSSRAFGVGLVQWDGYTQVDATTRQQKLVAYCIRNQYNWYDGWAQCYRIRGEWEKDDQYHFFKPTTVNGVTYTFSNYVTSTATPETLAQAWQQGYERNAGGLGFRGTNARSWYNWFNSPAAPDPVTPMLPEPESPYPEPDPSGIDTALLTILILQRKKKVARICRKI